MNWHLHNVNYYLSYDYDLHESVVNMAKFGETAILILSVCYPSKNFANEIGIDVNIGHRLVETLGNKRSQPADKGVKGQTRLLRQQYTQYIVRY